MVPGTRVTPNWWAVAVGALVLAVLCTAFAVDLSTEVPALSGNPPVEGEFEPGSGYLDPSLNLFTVGVTYAVGAPGPFIAGYFGEQNGFKGATEGAFAVVVGAVVVACVAAVQQFFLVSDLSLVWRLALVWRHVGTYAMIATPVVPAAAVVGGVFGWLGRFTNDAIDGGGAPPS